MHLPIAAALTFLLVGCEFPVRHTTPKGEVVCIIKPHYAEGFEIHVLNDSSRKLILFNLEKPGDTLQTIVWQGVKAQRVACLSTTHIAALNKLDVLESVKAVGFADMVRNAEARQLIGEGKIINLSTAHEVDDEVLYSVMPDVFFVYPFGGSNFEKYADKGINVVQVSEYLERHPLARAEWIKLFAVFFGKEKEANEVFDRIEKSYNDAKSKASLIKKRPTVFTGSSENGIWYAPPGNSFVGTLLCDAGSRYIFQDSVLTGNLSLQFESLFTLAHTADWWGKVVYEAGALTPEKIIESDRRLEQLKAFQAKQIFYCNASETDYFGDALMEPDVLLRDLVAVFHPEVFPQYQPVYFKKME